MGKAIFYTSPEPKLLNQSIPNFERMITSVKRRELPNLVVIGSTGVAPHVGEVYSYILGFFLLFSSFSSSSCFVNSPTDHNSQRILTYDGSKDVVWRKDVPFECPKCNDQLLRVRNLKKLVQ